MQLHRKGHGLISWWCFTSNWGNLLWFWAMGCLLKASPNQYRELRTRTYWLLLDLLVNRSAKPFLWPQILPSQTWSVKSYSQIANAPILQLAAKSAVSLRLSVAETTNMQRNIRLQIKSNWNIALSPTLVILNQYPNFLRTPKRVNPYGIRFFTMRINNISYRQLYSQTKWCGLPLLLFHSIFCQ